MNKCIVKTKKYNNDEDMSGFANVATTTKEDKKIVLALDSAWNERKKIRAKAMEVWNESNKLKKTADKKRKQDWAISDKMKARAPWKVKGMQNKRRNILSEVQVLQDQAKELRKKGDEINMRANNLWNDEVIRVCGNITQKWVKTGDGGRACTLENGLVFYN